MCRCSRSTAANSIRGKTGDKSAPEPAEYHALLPRYGSQSDNRAEDNPFVAEIASTWFLADRTHLSGEWMPRALQSLNRAQGDEQEKPGRGDPSILSRK